MPSRKRKHIKCPSSLSFITLDSRAPGVNWLKVHSGAARSHAAYWGGPNRRACRGEKQIKNQNSTFQGYSDINYPDLENVSASSPSSNIDTRKSFELVNSKASTASRDATDGFFRYSNSDSLHYLSQSPLETRSRESCSEAYLSIFKFLGKTFVRQVLKVEDKEHSLVLRSCLLLDYAYYMVFTGQGTKLVLLKLKGELIRHINKIIEGAKGMLSLRCLTAILALENSAVCLVSQDLPHGRRMWDYIHGSLLNEFLCCLPESLDIAQCADNEQAVHRQLMQMLFPTSCTSFRDAESLMLERYLSNYMKM